LVTVWHASSVSGISTSTPLAAAGLAAPEKDLDVFLDNFFYFQLFYMFVYIVTKQPNLGQALSVEELNLYLTGPSS
jgi:hypothetical protein